MIERLMTWAAAKAEQNAKLVEMFLEACHE